VCMIGALTVLPALLAVLGPKVNALPIGRRRPPPGRPESGERDRSGAWWGRVARSVMRRPVVYAAVTVALLAGLGAPFLRIHWGAVDASALPAGADARTRADAPPTPVPRHAPRPLEPDVPG